MFQGAARGRSSRARGPYNLYMHFPLAIIPRCFIVTSKYDRHVRFTPFLVSLIPYFCMCQVAHFLSVDVISSTVRSTHGVALLMAAIMHDYRHPGVNNGYLVRDLDPLALTYNDSSVLENFHASEGFKMMLHPKFDIFKVGVLLAMGKKGRYKGAHRNKGTPKKGYTENRVHQKQGTLFKIIAGNPF